MNDTPRRKTGPAPRGERAMTSTERTQAHRARAAQAARERAEAEAQARQRAQEEADRDTARRREALVRVGEHLYGICTRYPLKSATVQSLVGDGEDAEELLEYIRRIALSLRNGRRTLP